MTSIVEAKEKFVVIISSPLFKLRAIAENAQSQTAILTFSNHPSLILRPEAPVEPICTFKNKLRLFEAQVAEELAALPLKNLLTDGELKLFSDVSSNETKIINILSDPEIALLPRYTHSNDTVSNILADSFHNESCKKLYQIFTELSKTKDPVTASKIMHKILMKKYKKEKVDKILPLLCLKVGRIAGLSGLNSSKLSIYELINTDNNSPYRKGPVINANESYKFFSMASQDQTKTVDLMEKALTRDIGKIMLVGSSTKKLKMEREGIRAAQQGKAMLTWRSIMTFSALNLSHDQGKLSSKQASVQMLQKNKEESLLKFFLLQRVIPKNKKVLEMFIDHDAFNIDINAEAITKLLGVEKAAEEGADEVLGEEKAAEKTAKERADEALLDSLKAAKTDNEYINVINNLIIVSNHRNDTKSTLKILESSGVNKEDIIGTLSKCENVSGIDKKWIKNISEKLGMKEEGTIEFLSKYKKQLDINKEWIRNILKTLDMKEKGSIKFLYRCKKLCKNKKLEKIGEFI